jgi:hypothetical protein
MRLSDEEKAELKALAASPELKADLARLRASHRDDFIVDGEVVGERVAEALTGFSEFMAGSPRPRRAFIERFMKL